jgi:hypothetical protein
LQNEISEIRGCRSEIKRENVSHLAVAEFDRRLKKLRERLLKKFRSETRFPPSRPNIEQTGDLRCKPPARSKDLWNRMRTPPLTVLL